MGLNLLKNSEYVMFRIPTQFDALLGFGGNAHCLPIRVGRSRNLIGVKRVMVPGEIQPPIRSSKLLRIHVVDQGAHELSASPLYFWPRNPQSSSTERDELLNRWSILIPCTRKSGVMVSGPNALFSLRIFLIYQSESKQGRQDVSRQEGFQTMLPPGSTTY